MDLEVQIGAGGQGLPAEQAPWAAQCTDVCESPVSWTDFPCNSLPINLTKTQSHIPVIFLGILEVIH